MADRQATKPEQPMVLFRVHFVDGGKTDVLATNPAHARKIVEKLHAGIIDKVKRNKEQRA